MMSFATFVEEVQAALNHLYDPAFQPTAALMTLLDAPPLPGQTQWATVLLRAIETMQPAPDIPAEARAHRLYQVLTYRYAQQLTQEETAARLHITARHVRREQHDAVNVLAQILWQRVTTTADVQAPSLPAVNGAPPAESLPDAWSIQLRQELTALQRHQPEESANIGEVLRGVMELLQPVFHQAGIELRLGNLAPGAFATAQAVGVRQLLVRCLTEWVRHLTDGVIEGDAAVSNQQVVIRLMGADAPLARLREDPLVQELLTAYCGAIQIQQTAEAAVLLITLPAAPALRVLVVDDNEDLIHFYRRYLHDTRYQIVALSDGSQIFETVAAVQPALIILDVMLPGADGWNLLTQLRQHPLSRAIPVVVCSVIQEEALALALGANAYLAKPVRRAALIEALQAVTHLGGG